MKVKIAIRDLNSLANQLPLNHPSKSGLQQEVLRAVELKIHDIYLDDNDMFDDELIKYIALAKAKEQANNIAARRR